MLQASTRDLFAQVSCVGGCIVVGGWASAGCRDGDKVERPRYQYKLRVGWGVAPCGWAVSQKCGFWRLPLAALDLVRTSKGRKLACHRCLRLGGVRLLGNIKSPRPPPASLWPNFLQRQSFPARRIRYLCTSFPHFNTTHTPASDSPHFFLLSTRSGIIANFLVNVLLVCYLPACVCAPSLLWCYDRRPRARPFRRAHRRRRGTELGTLRFVAVVAHRFFRRRARRPSQDLPALVIVQRSRGIEGRDQDDARSSCAQVP